MLIPGSLKLTRQGLTTIRFVQVLHGTRNQQGSPNSQALGNTGSNHLWFFDNQLKTEAA